MYRMQPTLHEASRRQKLSLAVLRGIEEHIPDIANGLQIGWVCGIVFELSAQLQDKRAQVLPLPSILRAPNCGQQLGRSNSVGVR